MPLQIIDGGSPRNLTTAERLELSRAVGGLPVSALHSTAIPLDASYVMAPHTVAGALAFTAASPTIGGRCVLRLTANGSNTPTFPGTKVGAGSYVNTAGTVNVVTVWSLDGSGTYYSIEQAGASAPGAVAPGAVTNLAAGTATASAQPLTWTAPTTGTAPITYQVAYRLGTSTGAYTNFGSPVSGTSATVTGLAASTAYDYQVTPINAQGPGTPGVLNDASTAATGTPGPTLTEVRLINRTLMDEQGTAGAYAYKGTKSTAGFGCLGVSDLSIGAGSDGYFQYNAGAARHSVAGGIRTTQTAAVLAQLAHAVRSPAADAVGVDNRYIILNTNVQVNPLVNVEADAGDLIRLGRYNTGTSGVVRAHISKDGGSTWTLIYENATTSTAVWYFGLDMDNVSTVTGLSGSGVV